MLGKGRIPPGARVLLCVLLASAASLGAAGESPAEAGAVSRPAAESPAEAEPQETPETAETAETAEATEAQRAASERGYPEDPRALWGLLVGNQSRMHTLVKSERFTMEIMDEIAGLAGESGLLLVRISEAVPYDPEEQRVEKIRLRRSAVVAMHAVHSVGAAAESHVPGSLRVPLHTFDIQLKVVEERLPKDVIGGQLAREPEDVDVRKVR